MKIKKMIYQKDIKELLYTEKYKNYQYYILNLGTHPTAYVEIPKGNKLFGKTYNEIYEDDIDIEVHGGLTYSRDCLFLDKGTKKDNSWFIGWDYAHCDDYCGYEEYMPENIRTYGKKWTTEEIIEECKNAIDQIIDFESEEILEKEKKPVISKLYINNELQYDLGEKKIPEKLNLKLDDWTTPTQCDIELSKKIDEIIDYLKSKGE